MFLIILRTESRARQLICLVVNLYNRHLLYQDWLNRCPVVFINPYWSLNRIDSRHAASVAPILHGVCHIMGERLWYRHCWIMLICCSHLVWKHLRLLFGESFLVHRPIFIRSLWLWLKSLIDEMNSLHILFRHFLITICPEVDYSLQEFEFPLDVVKFRAQFYFFSFCHS